MSVTKFCIEYAKRGTAGCKKCKQKIDKEVLRIAKVVPNPFTDSGGDMKNWFHVDCIFDQFSRARATTKVIEDATDLDGWETINEDDKKIVLDHIEKVGNRSSVKKQNTANKNTPKKKKQGSVPAKADESTPKPGPGTQAQAKYVTTSDPAHRDNSFKQFRRVCAEVAEDPSYNEKTALIKKFIDKGASGNGFKGDLFLWMKLLMPGVIKRVYNLQSKQLVKLFSQIFSTNLDSMIADLEQGDVAETAIVFFETSKSCIPAKKSTLNVIEVDAFLEELSQLTREEDQLSHLKKICEKSTGNDLKMIVRLIKHDLRINSGAKHILDALHPDAYQVFQASRNLQDVVDKVIDQKKSGIQKSLTVGITVMTPVLPMLAEACKSVEYAMKKCPKGMYAEVKYDGERVQLHKQGNKFSYFSRSLKPVIPHKVQHFKDFIPKAFPHGNDLILDSEVLLIDTNTSTPLPFGTLSIHKKTAFTDANVCLFIFDCLMFNGESLMNKTIKERRKFLRDNMTEIPNRIMFSDAKEVHKPDDLKDMIMKAIREGLEGLVLKDLGSIYEPGKRHWLKVKKDYLADGAMADTADLVVLGAYYGTGNKGGMKSIFLMGSYDEKRKQWCTVTKVHGGHDDKTLDKLQTELDMIKISKDIKKIPAWLNINSSQKSLIPDFLIRDPKCSQVWEITGAEFTRAQIHTAKGISIRFPRVTCIRKDRSWNNATSVSELEELFVKSKQTCDIDEKNDSPVKNRRAEECHPEYDRETNMDHASGDENDSKANISENTISDKSDTNFPQKLFCKYGEKCKKTSSKHREKYSHYNPEYDEETEIDDTSGEEDVKRRPTPNGNNSSKRKLSNNTSDQISTDEPPMKMKKSDSKPSQKTDSHNLSGKIKNKYLLDIFTGLKIMIPDHLEKYKALKRYVLAFNGEVLEDFELDKATHVIGIENSAPVSGLSEQCHYVDEQWLWDCIKLKKVLAADPYILK